MNNIKLKLNIQSKNFMRKDMAEGRHELGDKHEAITQNVAQRDKKIENR